MKKRLLFLFLFASISTVTSGSDQKVLKLSPNALGAISEARGNISLTRKGKLIEAKKDVEIFEGDLVITEKGAFLAVTLRDQTRLSIGEKTKFRFENERNSSVTRLIRGTLLGWIKKITPNKIRNFVKTNHAVAGVKGTKFEVKIEKETTQINCFQGNMAVRQIKNGIPTGTWKTLKSGFRMKANSSKLTTATKLPEGYTYDFLEKRMKAATVKKEIKATVPNYSKKKIETNVRVKKKPRGYRQLNRFHRSKTIEEIRKTWRK